MASYKLLRSNKESGPYNLDDLVRFGLKAYDLVWVMDKSAAWRYPSEIPELKPYAPSVEEQPYDRFYKKKTQPVQEEQAAVQSYQPVHPQPVKKEQVLAEEQPYKAYQPAAEVQKPAIEEKYASYIPKKSVFVTMPGQKAAVAVQKPDFAEPKPVPEPTITVTENPTAAQIKYSQPLDEIKEMYVKTLQERKTKMARKSFMLSSLKKAAVIAGLILFGILAGYLIKSGAGNKNNTAVQTIQQPVANPAAADQKTAIDNNATLPDQSIASNTVTDPTTDNTPIPPAVKERLLQEEKKQYAENKLNGQPVTTTPVNTEPRQEQVPVRSTINDPVTGERTRQVRGNGDPGNSSAGIPDNNDSRSAAKLKKSGLENLVSVSTNDYKRVAFGGIRNLELTVTNDSKFLLDKVTVELQYLKPNETPLRTETVQFRTISPKGSSTIRIPDTNRGIKVLYKIVDIQSGQTDGVAAGF